MLSSIKWFLDASQPDVFGERWRDVEMKKSARLYRVGVKIL